MNIQIIKPFMTSGTRIIELDNVSITLSEQEIYDLYEVLDVELYYDNTRESLEDFYRNNS